MVRYSRLGAYLITATLANDINTSTDSMWVSVEVPVSALAVMSANMTSLTSPVQVTLDVNTDAAAPDRVVFVVSLTDWRVGQQSHGGCYMMLTSVSMIIFKISLISLM